MSAEQILAALRQLDPSNDNHWTAEGSPRLETLKLLAGGAALARDQVTAAAPGYSRATAGTYWQPTGTDSAAQAPAATPAAPPSTQPTTPDASAAPAPLSVASGGTDGQVQAQAAAGAGDGADAQAKPEDKVAALEAYHAEGRKFLESLRRERAELDAEIAKTEAALDSVVQEIDKARQSATVGGSVFRDYLNAQQKLGELRAARIEAMRGVNLKDLLPTKAKIDEVFARRQAHGNKRPAFPRR